MVAPNCSRPKMCRLMGLRKSSAHKYSTPMYGHIPLTKEDVGPTARSQVGADDSEKVRQRSGGSAPEGLRNQLDVRGCERQFGGRLRWPVNDAAAHIDFVILLGQR